MQHCGGFYILNGTVGLSQIFAINTDIDCEGTQLYTIILSEYMKVSNQGLKRKNMHLAC